MNPIEKKSNDAPKKQILSDHKKVGKRFIPPFMQLGNFHDIAWKWTTLPELLWLGLLNYSCGLKLGSDLALLLAKAAVQVSPSHPKIWHAPISSYILLTEAHKAEVLNILRSAGHLDSLRKPLAPLVAYYPQCPVAFLFESELPGIDEYTPTLETFKNFLTQMYAKYDTLATLAQANAIYIAFATDMLKVVKTSALADFPAIANFPNTEQSKRVAASIYASIPALMGAFLDQNFQGKQSEWSTYFWNRGLEIEPCVY